MFQRLAAAAPARQCVRHLPMRLVYAGTDNGMREPRPALRGPDGVPCHEVISGTSDLQATVRRYRVGFTGP